MQNKAPVPTSMDVEFQSTEVHQEGQQTKGHFPCQEEETMTLQSLILSKTALWPSLQYCRFRVKAET